MKALTLRLFFSMFFIWMIIRGGIYLLPGDPAEYLAHESLVPVPAAVIRESMGLNLSFGERLFSFPQTHSLINKVDALSLLKPAIQNTFMLTLLSFAFAFLLTLGHLFLAFRFPRYSTFIHQTSIFLTAVPLSVLGPILILLFCVYIPLFPITKSVLLPALCLALHLSAFWYRSIEKKINKFLPQSAVLGARARGLTERKVFLNYLFIPVLGSIASFLGAELGNLLSGSVLVEMIFQWNGIGSLLLKSVYQRDYPIIETALLITTILTVVSQQLGYWFQKKIGAAP